MPWQRDEYFKPLQELRDLLKPMMPHFAGISRIVISPHGAWYGLPLHTLLLPLLWNDRRDVGISYVPSLRALHLLQKRQKRTAPFAREPIALATVPAHEDENSEGQFLREHHLFTRLFRRTNRNVLSAYGVAATRQRILEEMRKAGLYHFLAHGLDAGAGDAMKSGLLVANDQGLPSRAACSTASSYPMLTAALVAANGTTASHVTLQACSLGRLHLAPGDEIWGMTRALLAGGANTVLAPLWDVDLEASSRLLRRFYLHWLLGRMPAWVALGAAQREMATGHIKAFRHFYHWGAFQLVGC
jgi:CHAT domain-containing protein